MSHSIARNVAISVGLLMLMAINSSSADKQVIGYVRDSLYHPLIVLRNDSLIEGQSRELELESWIINAFESNQDTVKCLEQIDYQDPYTDESARCCQITAQVEEENQYYLMGGQSLSKELIEIDAGTVRDFYEFFSRDEWGKQFVRNSDWITLPLESLYDSTKVWTEYATDLDHDGLQELWIRYRLKYGEKGRMVYEQNQGKTQWRRVANHCFFCD